MHEKPLYNVLAERGQESMGTAEDGGWTLANMGGSLPVANVQSLAASDDLREIPQRYIRPEIEAETILDGRSSASGEIPVLDLSRLLDHKHSDDEIMKLNYACEEWGFFQLINHGVSDEVIQRMKVDLQEFFKLPLEEKQASAQPPGSIEGYGQAFVLSEDQKLDWGDMLFLGTQPPSVRNMKLWPTQPPTFSATMEKYSLELRKVVRCLVGLMARSLGLLSPEKLTGMFLESFQSIRMNYYPPCPHANKVLGLSPHSDAVGLTLLLQVNEVQGLQIKKNGGWIPIKPLPGAFIVNIGDILEILTNGKYKSIEHRAIINTDKERVSIATFNNPNFSVPIGPITELVKKESKEHYKTLSSEDYVKLVISSKLEGKSLLNQMKLQN